MTREEIKAMLPIMQAFAEGKTLQYRVNEETNEWKDIDNPAFNDAPSEYRIKPEPKYRPFKNKEECWNEMWLARDSDNLLYLYMGPKPHKHNFVWNSLTTDIMRLDSDIFPEVQWTDKEPTKVKLVIDK